MGNSIFACCRLLADLILRPQHEDLCTDYSPLLSASRGERYIASNDFATRDETRPGKLPSQGYPDIILSSNFSLKHTMPSILSFAAFKDGCPGGAEGDLVLSDQKDSGLNSTVYLLALQYLPPTSNNLSSVLEEIAKQVKDHGCQPPVWHARGKSEYSDCSTDNRLCCEEAPLEIADTTDVGEGIIGLDSSSELLSCNQECDFMQKGDKRLEFKTKAPLKHLCRERVTKACNDHPVKDDIIGCLACHSPKQTSPLLSTLAVTTSSQEHAKQETVKSQVDLAPETIVGNGKLPDQKAMEIPCANRLPGSVGFSVTSQGYQGLCQQANLRKRRKRKRLLHAESGGYEGREKGQSQ